MERSLAPIIAPGLWAGTLSGGARQDETPRTPMDMPPQLADLDVLLSVRGGEWDLS